MKELSLHVLDIVQNSIKAKSSLIEISLDEDIKNDTLTIKIKDNGKGMDEELVKKVTDPFVTTRNTRKVGLGISLLKSACEMTEGRFEITSEKGIGTCVKATFKHSHIDRQPIGDIASTIAILISTNEKINFIYKHKYNEKKFKIDTREIKEILGEVSITLPNITMWLKDYINEGIKNINGGICQ